MQVQVRHIRVVGLCRTRAWAERHRTLVDAHRVSEGAREEVVVAFCDVRQDLREGCLFGGGKFKQRWDVAFVWEHC